MCESIPRRVFHVQAPVAAERPRSLPIRLAYAQRVTSDARKPFIHAETKEITADGKHADEAPFPSPDAEHPTAPSSSPTTRRTRTASSRPSSNCARPQEAPNVLIVLIDDAGFGSSSAFGGPCQTPNAEALAAGGLKYTALPHHRASARRRGRRC